MIDRSKFFKALAALGISEHDWEIAYATSSARYAQERGGTMNFDTSLRCCDLPSDVVNHSLWWSATAQGHDFWNNLHSQIDSVYDELPNAVGYVTKRPKGKKYLCA